MGRVPLAIVAVCAVLVPLTTVAAQDPGEALRDAAVAGDVAATKRILDAGTPVDAKAPRYGQTPLLLAAGKGHLELVTLLVERGADVNARETFFGSTPLSAALQENRKSVALYLLSRGAGDVEEALQAAVDGGDLDLARAAAATNRIEPLALKAARKDAAAKPSKEMQAFLATIQAPAPVRQPFPVSPEDLQKLVGRYRSASGEANVSARGTDIVIAHVDRPELVLKPIGRGRFETAAGDAGAEFYGRAGTIEGLAINRDGEVVRLGVPTSDPAPLRVATATPGEGRVERGAAQPWPQFRGPRASGNGDGQGVPMAWDVAKGVNVRFKTPIPGLGQSSPIVWSDRIYVTTAVSARGERSVRTGLYGDGTSVDDVSIHSFRLFALDARTGAIVWDREVHNGPPGVRRHLKSSLSNSTPATDGKTVVVLFGPVGVLAAYDATGALLWKKDIGILDCNDPQAGVAEWGHASSPILYRDKVIVQADRRKESFLAAYALKDGKEVWRVARPEPSTWSTPNVLAAPTGDELVTNGQTIRGYDPSTGKQLWSLGPNSEVVVSTPVIAEDKAFVTAGYPPVRPVYAVRAGQRGDLTLPRGETASAAIAWSHSRGGTYIPTPLYYRGFLYTVNNNGILTCYDSKTGAQAYQTRLGEVGASFAASPVAADGRIYFASETGEVYVLRAGPEYALLGTNGMDEVTMATPAMSDGVMIVRTVGHVVGLAESSKSSRLEDRRQ
jgi:outer membrane protein assembly factor BamB